MASTAEIEERPFKRTRLFGALQEIIVLVVGKGVSSHSYQVHKDILCATSPFFKSACKPEDKVIKLPEDDPEAVQTMVYWIYHNEICITEDIKNRGGGSTRDKALNTVWGLFIKLYVLGDKYQIEGLRNDAIDALIIFSEDNYLIHGVASYAYENTSNDSPLRRLLLRIAHSDFSNSKFDAVLQVPCSELLADMLHWMSENKCDSKRGYVVPVLEVDDDFCACFHEHKRLESECEFPKKFIEIPKTADDKKVIK